MDGLGKLALRYAYEANEEAATGHRHSIDKKYLAQLERKLETANRQLMAMGGESIFSDYD